MKKRTNYFESNLFTNSLIQLFQVECKKAQPKEVMLPSTIARARVSNVPRGNYGEFLHPASFRYPHFINCHNEGGIAAVHAAALHAASIFPMVSSCQTSGASDFILHSNGILRGNSQGIGNICENFHNSSISRNSPSSTNDKNSIINIVPVPLSSLNDASSQAPIFNYAVPAGL